MKTSNENLLKKVDLRLCISFLLIAIMALATADLNHRLCHSQIHEALLEDSVENIGTLVTFDVDTREDDGRTFVNALYTVDGSSLVGTILRRPFQGLSNMTIEHDDMYAAALIWVDSKDRRITLEKVRKTYDSIAFETFKNRQIYLVDLNCLEIRIAFLVPSHVHLENLKAYVPKHIGKGKGIRWTPEEFIEDSSSILAQGSLQDHQKFVILLHIHDSNFSAQCVIHKPDTDAFSVQSSQSSSSNASQSSSSNDSNGSQSSQQGPSRFFVESILHGQHSGLEDLRLALVWPESIQKVCK